MNEDERGAYQAAYCGLCHAMGKRHGWMARYTLNYDFTFLAILFSGHDHEIGAPLRCPAHPFRAKNPCLHSAGLETAADGSMILTWHKLRDDVKDRGFFRGLPARLLSRLLRGAYRKAAAALPEFDRQVLSGLEKLAHLERERSPKLDLAADAFASILKAAAPSCEEGRKRVMEQLLYHVGRWIYLVDAWDDLEEDRRAGRYNPLNARFEGRAEEEREYIATTMTHSLNLAISSANLGEFGRWTPVVENILYIGLPAVQEAVLSGQWKQLQRKRREIDQ